MRRNANGKGLEILHLKGDLSERYIISSSLMHGGRQSVRGPSGRYLKGEGPLRKASKPP